MIITDEMKRKVLNRVKNMTRDEFEEIDARVKSREPINLVRNHELDGLICQSVNLDDDDFDCIAA